MTFLFALARHVMLFQIDVNLLELYELRKYTL